MAGVVSSTLLNQRPYLILVGLVFLALTGWAPAAWGQPQAVFPETSRDFGEFTQDQEQSHAFPVKNTGNAPLRLLEVDPDCACTASAYDKEIPPGGEGRITLKLKPFSVSKQFQKKTRVRTDDPNNPQVTLLLTGIARPVVELLPSHIVRFQGPVSQAHEAQVRLVSHQAKPLEIRELKNNQPERLLVSLKAEEPGKSYLITVKNLAQQPGKYAGKIEILTNIEKRPMVLMRVFADLYPEDAKP